ncbi:hypothetical protein D3C87_1623770 [compost metagenome]
MRIRIAVGSAHEIHRHPRQGGTQIPKDGGRNQRVMHFHRNAKRHGAEQPSPPPLEDSGWPMRCGSRLLNVACQVGWAGCSTFTGTSADWWDGAGWRSLLFCMVSSFQGKGWGKKER